MEYTVGHGVEAWALVSGHLARRSQHVCPTFSAHRRFLIGHRPPLTKSVLGAVGLGRGKCQTGTICTKMPVGRLLLDSAYDRHDRLAITGMRDLLVNEVLMQTPIDTNVQNAVGVVLR